MLSTASKTFPRPLPPNLASDDYERIRYLRALNRLPRFHRDHADSAAHSNFDILSYDLFLIPDHDHQTIHGTCIVFARAIRPEGLSELGLNLAGLAVESVSDADTVLDWSHEGDSLRIHLPEPIPSGDSVTVRITYGGAPSSGFHFTRRGSYIVDYTYNAPYLARYWFPCWDYPGDKARARITTVAPADHVVLGNGYLESVTPPHEGVRTWVWREDHPIATYLISVASGQYATIRDTALVDGVPIPLEHDVTPDDSLEAIADFAHVPEFLDYFARYTGHPYPFDKYGHAAAPGLGGAMENQSAVTYGSSLITGDRSYETVVAHEAAHMWFGDLVTPVDFRNVWLSEGFATYWEGMAMGNLYGEEMFRARIAAYRSAERPFWNTSPIYDPPLSLIYASNQYEKAALVLHMLRFVLGDTPFQELIQRYVRDQAYGHASTYGFQTMAEEVYGDDLDWFFDEWIYGVGKPNYRWDWRPLGSNEVLLEVRQTQDPLFRMPVPIRLYGSWGTQDHRIEVARELETFSLNSPGPVDSVAFDPDLWILAEQDRGPVHIGEEDSVQPHPGFQLGLPAPNPFNPDVAIPYVLPQTAPIRIDVYDLRGRCVQTLADDTYPAGRHVVRWDGQDDERRPVASGIYVVVLTSGPIRQSIRVALIR